MFQVSVNTSLSNWDLSPQQPTVIPQQYFSYNYNPIIAIDTNHMAWRTALWLSTSPKVYYFRQSRSPSHIHLATHYHDHPVESFSTTASDVTNNGTKLVSLHVD
jgi:hypothetical protein